MVQAILTCGKCGAALTANDTLCPACHTPVEFPAAATRPAGVCTVCGHRNDPAADYCQSCGARLAGGTPRTGAEPPARERQKPSKAQRPSRKKEEKSRDPWPYVALAALVVLVGVILYTQWDHSPSTPAHPPGTMAQPGNITPSNAASPAEILQLQQSVEADPNNPDLVLHLANVLQDNGQYTRAIASYGKYLTLRPRDPDARVDMGICYYQLGMSDSANARRLFSTAVKEMRTAFDANPNHQPAAFNMGIVYLQMQDLDSSTIWFKRAVAIKKDSDLGERAQRILEQHAAMQ